MSAAVPKVSICIPTYNRATYLRDLLAELFASQPSVPFEVVISDNCSNDNTDAVIAEWSRDHPQIRSFRQSANVGAFSNMLTVLRLARGEYCTYLADDARLIMPVLEGILQYMSEQPDVVCYYAPQDLWDDQAGVSGGPAYIAPPQARHTTSEPIALFNYLFANAVWPEICVYKTDAVQRVIAIPKRANFFFVLLAELLEFGDVVFGSEPFYRQFLRHKTGATPGLSVGESSLVDGRDAHQAGLQYLAQRALQRVGVELDKEQKAALNEMIDGNTDAALVGGTEVLLKWRDYRSAYEFLLRQKVRGCAAEAQMSDYRQNGAAMAAVQAAVDVYERMTVVERFVVFALPDLEGTKRRLLEYRPALEVTVIDEAELPRCGDQSRTFTLVGSDEARTKLVSAGFERGLIMSEADLLRQYQL